MQIYTDKLFENSIDIITAFNKESLQTAFDKIQNYKDKYLLGYIRYETKNIFFNKDYSSNLPLLYFEVFDSYKYFQPEKIVKNYLLAEKPLISKDEYSNSIDTIKDKISNGITYEVNYTYPTKIYSDLRDFELYQLLLSEQKTNYNAFISNKYETLLSFSPELFFTINNNRITTKPMKGTVKRGTTALEDETNIEFLKTDIKNKAENVMIVDLLRNDLSRIAKAGSVKVEKLFEIETHKSVHQMTSTISAELRDDIDLYQIFESIFPCGSITGAPKISTMRVIDEVENFSGDIYCGAIGFISPKESVFSVPIRILQKQNSECNYLCHTGGAIVWDSDTDDEWEETFVKRKFLPLSDFNLVETMKAESGKILFKNEHLERMRTSAEYFGFKYNPELDFIKAEKNGIVRILLSKNGEYNIEYKDLEPVTVNKVTFAKNPVQSSNPFLYHKTDNRYWYDESMQKIREGLVFDEIYFNERNEITEGARSNIVIEKNSCLYTPFISSGILNGIYRQHLLPNLIEKVLYKEDLLSADKIYCINSIMGMVEVELCL